MSAHDEEYIQHLLRQALPPVEAEPEPEHDLWPAVRCRLNEQLDAQHTARSAWVWFDWALAAGLAIMALSFPASIPLFLYYL